VNAQTDTSKVVQLGQPSPTNQGVRTKGTMELTEISGYQNYSRVRLITITLTNY